MKNKILLTICLFALVFFSAGSADAKQAASEKEVVTVCCTPDVQHLAQTFAEEYGKKTDELEFSVKLLPLSDFSEEFNKSSSIGFISGKSGMQVSEDFRMLVARDIIVPVTHVGNPGLADLEGKGISARKLRELVAKNSEEAPTFYVLSQKSAESCVAAFFNVSPSECPAIKVETKEELIQKLQRDKTAIGFCCLPNITGDNGEFAQNLKILPIDRNENGRADYIESVYSPVNNEDSFGVLSSHEKSFGSLNTFMRGVWIGKYPQSLVNEVYIVSAGLPENENVTDFLAWAVTDGQQVVSPAGYNELVYNERQSKLDALQPQVAVMETEEAGLANSTVILIVLIALLIVTVPVLIAAKLRGGRSTNSTLANAAGVGVLNENTVQIPNGLYFDKTHTWTFMEKDGSVKVGIDDFMQNVTGKLTGIKMKNPGEQIAKNEPLVMLTQEGKQLEIYAPISGKIKEINEDLVTDPSAINQSPYSEGWIYTIEPTNWQRETSFMKMAESYKEWLKKEFARLKDFLAVSVNADAKERVAFQEGGELNANLLQNFGPRIWEDFQKNFIETSDLN